MSPSKVDFSRLRFSTPKMMDNGGKMLYVNYGEGTNSLYVTTPEVEIPFDPSYYAENDNSGKYQIKFSMKNLDSNKAMKDFHTWATEMDNIILQKASENSQAWFRKAKLSQETLKELYTPMVKVSTDPETGEPNGKYPDSFGFKVVKRDGKFKDFKIYNQDKVVYDVNGDTEEPVDITSVLIKGSLIKVVLKCNSIWIANGKFGCGWKAEQIRVKLPEGGLKEFAIMSDSEDESDEETNEQPVSNMIEDSSDDEDVTSGQEQGQEPEPEPEKKKVKRVVKKKKTSTE